MILAGGALFLLANALFLLTQAAAAAGVPIVQAFGAPAVQLLGTRSGLLILARAGFTVDPPGCSMCLGLASRKAAKDEVWLSSQNRNFRNRMGEGSLAWVSSAATVAASAPVTSRLNIVRFPRF